MAKKGSLDEILEQSLTRTAKRIAPHVAKARQILEQERDLAIDQMGQVIGDAFSKQFRNVLSSQPNNHADVDLKGLEGITYKDNRYELKLRDENYTKLSTESNRGKLFEYMLIHREKEIGIDELCTNLGIKDRKKVANYLTGLMNTVNDSKGIRITKTGRGEKQTYVFQSYSPSESDISYDAETKKYAIGKEDDLPKTTVGEKTGRGKLLKYLLSHLDKTMKQTEIKKITGWNKNTVQSNMYHLMNQINEHSEAYQIVQDGLPGKHIYRMEKR